MSAHDPSRTAAGVTLPTLVADLRGRCEAVSRLQGGSTYFREELAVFLQAVEELGLLLHDPPDELKRPPDDEGNEHQVWYSSETSDVLKATWPGFFGLLVVHRTGEEPQASPINYLERWALHNDLFGDEVRFLGVLSSDRGIRLLIRQPAIAGTPANDEEIRDFFTGSGWRRFVIDGNVAYFDPDRRVVISDTHRGNLIKMEDGLLAPIDLRIQPVSGALFDIVTALCPPPPSHR